jgi:hypothetical protein
MGEAQEFRIIDYFAVGLSNSKDDAHRGCLV